MESNFEEPLAFFEYMVNEDNLCKILNDRLYYSDYTSYGINLPNERKCVEQDEYGEYFKSTLSVKNEILPILRIEFEKSKKLIKDKYLKRNPNLNPNLLRYLFNTLQSIIYYNSDFINKYPYILFPIRGIVNFINRKLLLQDMQPFQLNEDNIDTIPINENFNIERTNDEIIRAIFSFMNGKNEKQEIILLKEDYDLLIQYITFLVEKENIPKIQKRLSPKLRKDIIRFSFWVLHYELYTTKRIRKYFFEFIKTVFSDFETDLTNYISNQFGTKSRVPNEKFLPEIIKNHLISS